MVIKSANGLLTGTVLCAIWTGLVCLAEQVMFRSSFLDTKWSFVWATLLSLAKCNFLKAHGAIGLRSCFDKNFQYYKTYPIVVIHRLHRLLYTIYKQNPTEVRNHEEAYRALVTKKEAMELSKLCHPFLLSWINLILKCIKNTKHQGIDLNFRDITFSSLKDFLWPQDWRGSGLLFCGSLR